MSELKPCPFCGHENASVFPPTCTEETAYDPGDRAFPIVRCYKCHSEKAGDNWDHSCESAINQWNTRATDTELAAAKARIAELEKALEPFAALGESYDESFCDDDEATFADDELTVGDLRRAAELLEEPTND